MPKKEKKSKTSAEKQIRKIITLADLSAQEAKFRSLLEGIQETREKIRGIQNIIKSRINKTKRENAWKKYISCNGLPDPSVPTEIRNFLAKWQHYEDLRSTESYSWRLKIDERSVLTQDIDAIDYTKKHLKATQDDPGYAYNNHIERMLTVLNELKIVLVTSKNIPLSIFTDLLELKDVMIKAIQGCIDTFTFRLVRDREGYLNELDDVTADYHFKSNVIKLHLWSFKNVPIQFQPDSWPFKSVYLHCLKTKVVLPFAVLCSNLVLRGLHMAYDHYSEFTKTINLSDQQLLVSRLEKTLINEWELRTELRNDVKMEMIKQRQEYEEWFAFKEEERKKKEEQDKREKKDKGGDEGEKAVKKTKSAGAGQKFKSEPVKLDKTTFPDIEQDFWDLDDQRYQDFLNECNPENFLLEEGEINLRQYVIIGGVYEFNFVQTPNQTNFPNLIITWLEHPIELKYKNRNCFLKDVDFESIGLKRSSYERGGSDDDDLHDTGDAKTQQPMGRLFQPQSALTFFIITFKVPKEICRWQQPTVCQWYDIPKPTNEAEEIPPKIEKDWELKTPVIINDFILSRTLKNPMIFHIINHLVPRLISVHRFPEELKKRSTGKKRFALEETETIDREEKTKQIEKAPTDRLFPIFQIVKPVIITPIEEDILAEERNKDETLKLFSEYISELDHIKFTRFPQFKEIKVAQERTIVEEKQEPPSIDIKTKRLRPDNKFKKGGKGKEKGQKELTDSIDADVEAKLEQSIPSPLDPLEEEEEDEDVLDTKSGIDQQSVDSKLECFGAFAFAFKKYIHLPFRVWTIQPDQNNYKIIKFYAEGKHAKFCIDISEEGYNVQVLDYKTSKGHPIVLYENKEIIKDTDSLKEKLKSLDMNIFPEEDAVMYIKKIPLKLPELEHHTYECMGLFCMSMQFCISQWNCLSHRRVIVMQCRSYDEDISALECIKITPEECEIVNITELCTDLDKVELAFDPTGKNLKYNPDLHSLLNSAYFRVLSNLDPDQMYNPKLQYNVIEYLKAVKPISFSR